MSDAKLDALRSRYAQNLPQRLAELQTSMATAAQSPPTAPVVADAVMLAHRLAGTAGTYGFFGVAELGAECERLLRDYQANGIALPDTRAIFEKALEEQNLSTNNAYEQGQESRDNRPQPRIKGQVLVIDDDEDFLAVIAQMLEQSHYLPITLSDIKGLEKLIESVSPDLILLDLEMPEVSGTKVCRTIRASTRWHNLPIIFLTARNTPKDRIAAFRAGADDYLNKPVIREELQARVDVRIERSRMARERQLLLQQAEDQRDSLLSLLDQLRIGTLLLDADGRVVFVNRYCGYLGLEPEVGGKQPWEALLPFNAEGRRHFQQQLALPAEERSRFPLSWKQGNRQYSIECEIRDVPDSEHQKIVCLTDVSELHRLRQRLDASRYGRMLGESSPMRELYRLIESLARGNWTVLIEGETGVGKELVAHSIHEASLRKDGPFIAVNSAGLSESLLASQLFGHRKGAFTGATADQEGFFEAAQGGSLFLDEIGDLPLSMQASLLRVLQEKEITRLGETRVRKVDVRIIAATHKDLASEVRAGHFRQDLLYRLRVARVYVPALRERGKDVSLLAEGFLREASQFSEQSPPRFSDDAMQSLQHYDWPGNVRELKAAIDYAVIHCQGERILAADLPPEIGRVKSTTPRDLPIEPIPLPSGGDPTERILAALQQAGGNRTQAARLLGVSRATFYRQLSKLGLSGDK
jgi:DNA-binding NtrC family response regulator